MSDKKILCGMGNPLLDIQATVAAGYLDKYGLESNNQILAEDKHLPIYKELVSWFPVDYFPGGATLNSIRVAQVQGGVVIRSNKWVFIRSNKCGFIRSLFFSGLGSGGL